MWNTCSQSHEIRFASSWQCGKFIPCKLFADDWIPSCSVALNISEPKFYLTTQTILQFLRSLPVCLMLSSYMKLGTCLLTIHVLSIIISDSSFCTSSLAPINSFLQAMRYDIVRIVVNDNTSLFIFCK
jgi:hypothetical protein